MLRNRPYVLWRDAAGDLAATDDRCSHREAQLSRGTLDHGCLRCPYHGWLFDADARCIEIPSSGDGASIPPSAHLVKRLVEEHYGLVWLCPGTPRLPIPVLDVEEQADSTRLNTSMQVWNCSATRMIDNMLDLAHFAYTHVGTFGSEANKQVEHFALKELDETFTGYEYEVLVTNEGDAKAMSGAREDLVRIAMSTGFALPFSVRSTMHYENGIKQTLFMTASPSISTPEGTEQSYFTFVLWRNDDVSETGSDIVEFELQVALEDQAMLEAIPGELTIERSGLVDVQSDKASARWRHRLRELIGYTDAAS